MADKPRILISFCSRNGSTEALAKAVAEGARPVPRCATDGEQQHDVDPLPVHGPHTQVLHVCY